MIAPTYQPVTEIESEKRITSTSAKYWLCGLVLIHSLLLGWLAYRHSPTQDEIAHLPAGMVIWKHGDFSVYRVNPPLVRAIAAIPILLTTHEEDWTWYRADAGFRHEWNMGRSFVKANGPRSYWLFTLARSVCIPFSLLGMVVCFRWGSELTSEKGGLLAAALWCFSPNVLGHGALITPDIAATSLGLLAAWRFSKWLQASNLRYAFLAGIALGVALLTKTYWVSLLGLWPLMALMNWYWKRDQRDAIQDIAHALLMLFVGLNVLNLGYLFHGTGTQLKNYDFYSRSLSGKLRIPGENLPANRFTDSWLGEIPLPFPKDYVTGIDLQKVDFEQGKWSYFLGEVKKSGGWPHYYLVGLFLKVPLGTWFLLGLGLLAIIRSEEARISARRLLPLIIPVVVLFIVASLQTNMNRHIRYVFPALPATYLVGSLAISRWPKLSTVAVVCTVGSSLSVFPHSLSFFNYSISGPNNGHRYLIDSNLDWGQDLIYVREWLEANPEKQPAWIGWSGDVPVASLGIEAKLVPQKEFAPGWYLISRHQRYHPNQRLKAFESMNPVDQIGYTFDVYQVESNLSPKDSL